MRWDDNLVFAEAGPELGNRVQYQLAMYAVHLSLGHTIHCKSIKAATIEQYVWAAASFIAMFSGVDYRKDHPSDRHMGHLLAPVYRDLKKYETVPNRREPYDHQMHRLAKRLGNSFPPNSLVAAMVDGFELAFCAGYRLSEWAQPDRRTDPMRPQLNHLVSSPMRTRAIVPNDVRIVSVDNRRAAGLGILAFAPMQIGRLFIKFRTQKNGQHGEEKLFILNPNQDGVCFVRSVYRSLARFQRLRSKDTRLNPSAVPLSVYWAPRERCVKLINANDIEHFMRRLAAVVHNLHPVRDAEDLQKWSSHSLRVGACVTLHAMGFSALDIQFILRWRSSAFMVYLRNVAILATRHIQSYDRASAQPFL